MIHAKISSISHFKQPPAYSESLVVEAQPEANKPLCRPLPVDRISPPPCNQPPGNA